MSSVNNVGNTSPVNRIQTPQPMQKTQETQTPSRMRAADKLELSGASHLLAALKKGTDMRVDKVAEIKAAIEANTYESDQKLDAAIDRLIDDLNK